MSFLSHALSLMHRSTPINRATDKSHNSKIHVARASRFRDMLRPSVQGYASKKDTPMHL